MKQITASVLCYSFSRRISNIFGLFHLSEFFSHFLQLSLFLRLHVFLLSFRLPQTMHCSERTIDYLSQIYAAENSPIVSNGARRWKKKLLNLCKIACRLPPAFLSSPLSSSFRSWHLLLILMPFFSLHFSSPFSLSVAYFWCWVLLLRVFWFSASSLQLGKPPEIKCCRQI